MNKNLLNFVNITTVTNETLQPRDTTTDDNNPLQDIEMHDEKPIYYRLNNTVFAEPIQPVPKNSECGNKIQVIDNVVVQKRDGRRNKYHIDINDESAPKCPQTNCNNTFTSVILLKAHVRKVHCTERLFVCEHCGGRFKAKYLLVRHMAVHDGKTLRCPMCDKLLSARTNIRQHMRTHTNTREHECVQCHKRFLRRVTLATHVKFVHDRDLSCQRCGTRFDTRGMLSRHTRTRCSGQIQT